MWVEVQEYGMNADEMRRVLWMAKATDSESEKHSYLSFEMHGASVHLNLKVLKHI